MKYFNMDLLIKIRYIFFYFFISALIIFNGTTRVNNIFHIVIVLSFFMIILRMIKSEASTFRMVDFYSILASSLFLLYYCLNALLHYSISEFASNLVHSIYILLLLSIIIESVKTKIVSSIFIGVLTLSILTIISANLNGTLTQRLSPGFPFAPENAIDLGGYFCIGIYMGLILLRDTRKKIILLPISLFFVTLLLTKSRGPVISLAASLFITYGKFLWSTHKNNIKKLIYPALALLFIILMTSVFSRELLSRFFTIEADMSVRGGIWSYSFTKAMQHPVLGWGINEKIDFINGFGATVHTTHSLYLGAFLKGGALGLFLLILVLVIGIWRSLSKKDHYPDYESGVFIFSIIFYLTQGMFIIGNPSEAWVLFWIPLGIILNSRKINKRQ